jgi:hypothetical protein
MYIEQLSLTNIRTFEEAKLDFVHSDRTFRHSEANGAGEAELWPRPRLPNVNLLLGDNGSGKTTVLMSVALASLGPTAKLSVLQTVGMVRRGHDSGRVLANLRVNQDDVSPGQDAVSAPIPGMVTSEIQIGRYGDLELHEFKADHPPVWAPIYKSDNGAFFVVGYGATRRVERPQNVDMGARLKARFGRVQRFQSLFDDSFSLVPLSFWLPREKDATSAHYKEVVELLNAVLKPAGYGFTGRMEKGDYLFERGGHRVPFLLMSDGYRAFIGWVADLLYHLATVTPRGNKLAEARGVVMVDEIDLHLHPRWQMSVIRTVAKTLPWMQFIFTSHSPLVAGSLERSNIITLKLAPKSNRTVAKRLKESIHGLDADQVLLTDFFGLKTTRAPGKVTQLEKLERKARHGDREAARKIILAMSRGTEESE